MSVHIFKEGREKVERENCSDKSLRTGSKEGLFLTRQKKKGKGRKKKTSNNL